MIYWGNIQINVKNLSMTKKQKQTLSTLPLKRLNLSRQKGLDYSQCLISDLNLAGSAFPCSGLAVVSLIGSCLHVHTILWNKL